MQQISSQKHFSLQLSESLFVISGCVIYEIYEKLFMSTEESLHGCTFFSYHDFVPLGFSGKIFNETV